MAYSKVLYCAFPCCLFALGWKEAACDDVGRRHGTIFLLAMHTSHTPKFLDDGEAETGPGVGDFFRDLCRVGRAAGGPAQGTIQGSWIESGGRGTSGPSEFLRPGECRVFVPPDLPVLRR